MDFYNSILNFSNATGMVPDDILTSLIIVWAHWVFVEVVVSAFLMFTILKGLEWLVPRFMLFMKKRKAKRK